MHVEKIRLTEYDIYFCSEECLRKYMLESDMIEYIKEDENEKENDFYARRRYAGQIQKIRNNVEES